jgi:hypothetical protein
VTFGVRGGGRVLDLGYGDRAFANDMLLSYYRFVPCGHQAELLAESPRALYCADWFCEICSQTAGPIQRPKKPLL